MLASIELQHLRIPFRSAFKHASAERAETDSVLATVTTSESVSGHGEGCPRVYVTGETTASCFQFLEAHRASILTIRDLATLRRWVEENGAIIDKNPAAWCAIETAILDAFGKAAGLSIEELLGLPPLAGTFHFTAVLGAAKPETFSKQLAQYVQLGFREFKMKIAGDEATDLRNFAALTAECPGASIRFDFNNLWQTAPEAIRYVAAFGPNFWAFEEPLRANDYDALRELGAVLKRPIILDESFCRIEQFAPIAADAERWIPNIRVSKMGGLLRSLAIAERCTTLGMKFIIGAQVGETSILTRMALTVANTHRQNLRAQEAAFGTYLLTTDITAAPLMFGKQGELTAPEPKPGHGIALISPHEFSLKLPLPRAGRIDPL